MTTDRAASGTAATEQITRSTPEPAEPRRDGSRFSARLRILGWILGSTALVLTAMVVTVSSALEARAARDANEDVVQELAEFRQFTAEGVNPETASAFTSVEPMLDVFLRRQQRHHRDCSDGRRRRRHRRGARACDRRTPHPGERHRAGRRAGRVALRDARRAGRGHRRCRDGSRRRTAARARGPAGPDHHHVVRRRRARSCRTRRRSDPHNRRMRRLGNLRRRRWTRDRTRRRGARQRRRADRVRRRRALAGAHAGRERRRPAPGRCRDRRRLQHPQRALRTTRCRAGVRPAEGRHSRAGRAAQRRPRSLGNVARRIQRRHRRRPRPADRSGNRASGGLGAALAAVCGAALRTRFEVLTDGELSGIDLNSYIERADLVLTAEGAVDYQTPRGKVPAEVAARAKRYGKPVIALAGSIGEGATDVHEIGIDAVMGIIPIPMDLAQAVSEAAPLVANATERTLRLVTLGCSFAATS